MSYPSEWTLRRAIAFIAALGVGVATYIAVFGIVGYVLLLASAFFANDLARFGGFVVALGGFGYSVFLTYVEIFKIEAICQWCVGSAVLMTILFALNAIRLTGYAGTEPEGAVRSKPREATG
jgi:uncharacterized membrane protein